jgi:hypothetical protein
MKVIIESTKCKACDTNIDWKCCNGYCWDCEIDLRSAGTVFAFTDTRDYRDYMNDEREETTNECVARGSAHAGMG